MTIRFSSRTRPNQSGSFLTGASCQLSLTCSVTKGESETGRGLDVFTSSLPHLVLSGGLRSNDGGLNDK